MQCVGCVRLPRLPLKPSQTVPSAVLHSSYSIFSLPTLNNLIFRVLAGLKVPLIDPRCVGGGAPIVLEQKVPVRTSSKHLMHSLKFEFKDELTNPKNR